MHFKKVLMNSCFVGLCMVVGSFLYNHMHQTYPLNEGYTISGTETTITNLEEVIHYPTEYIKDVDDKFKFDVTIKAGNAMSGKEFPLALAQKQLLNKEFIVDEFIGNDLVPTSYKSKDVERESILLDVYDDGEQYLALSDYEFTYMKSPDIDYVFHTFFPDSKTDQYNSFLYSTSSDLDFMSREQAWERVVEYMQELNMDMTLAVPYTVYSLDLETMMQEERYVDHNNNIMLEDKNPHWDKEEEGYLYFITQEYEGIPFYAYPKINQGDEETIAPMEIYQNANEMIKVKLMRWFNVIEQKEKSKLLPIEAIMSVIEEKYKGTLHTNALTVKNASLFIFPINNNEGNYVLTPVWVCRIEEKHEDLGQESYESYIYMAINALTAEEMPALVY